MPIFQLMAVQPTAWFITRIDKAARGFLWANKEAAPGAKCLINWTQVCTPKVYGGLGIPDLAARSTALRCRWLWQCWMEPNKPWTGLQLPIDSKVRAIFDASVIITIGDGEGTQFWTDRWRPEGKLCNLFPDLYKLCTLRRISVRKALDQNKWIGHFKVGLTTAAIRQFTELWNLMRDVNLQQGVPDSLIWKWTADGTYTASSAYAMQFIGAIRPAFAPLIWRADAPPKCKFFAWLAVQGRCLTADVLAKRGCQHDPLCPLCRLQPETAAHLLAACPFAQNIWRKVIDRAALPVAIIPHGTIDLSDWMIGSSLQVGKHRAKPWRALIPLVWWTLWKERNDRIFRLMQSTADKVFQALLQEASSWAQAGRPSAHALLNRPREPD
ncbi:hypothetical protein ACQ4PT_012055 [Festuca glaucescens]